MTESDLRVILGKNLRRYRTIKGYSQAKLAEILDISPNFISDIETGKRWLSSDTLVYFSETLGVEPYELIKPQEVLTNEKIEFIQNFTKKASVMASNAVIKSLNELNNQFLEVKNT
jgi:transcriptional regulator with XRE-family HTH domain